MAKLRPDRTWLAYKNDSGHREICRLVPGNVPEASYKFVAVFTAYAEAHDWLVSSPRKRAENG